LLRDGATVAEAEGETLEHRSGGAGAYRLEVRLPHDDRAWLVTNPVYVSA
jgi:hypothetical protein